MNKVEIGGGGIISFKVSLALSLDFKFKLLITSLAFLVSKSLEKNCSLWTA